MSRRRRVGWGDKEIGDPRCAETRKSKRRPAKANAGVELDLAAFGLEDLDDPEAEPAPSAPAKKRAKKRAKRKPKLKCSNGCEGRGSTAKKLWDLREVRWDQVCANCAKAKWKKRSRYVEAPPKSALVLCVCSCAKSWHTLEGAGCRRCAKLADEGTLSGKPCSEWSEAEDQTPPWEDEVDSKTAAGLLDVDLSSECPVCRSLEGCGCDEDDRTFQRRVRFEGDVKKLARCPRCRAPLSVIYVPRPGEQPDDERGWRLPQIVASYGCSICSRDALATIALRAGGSR